MNRQTQMDQHIFEWGLPMETVSVYLLLTGLADTDTALSLETIRSIWNADEADLSCGLDRLCEKGIIRKAPSDSTCYELEPFDRWIR